MCDFMGKPGVITEQVKEWSTDDSEFLTFENVSSDLKVVIDNTGYAKPFSNMMRSDSQFDVTYELSIQTEFISNDLYRTVMYGFLIAFASLVAVILINLVLY